MLLRRIDPDGGRTSPSHDTPLALRGPVDRDLLEADNGGSGVHPAGRRVQGLPDELLELILSFVGSRWLLTTVPMVCRAWRVAACNVPAIVEGPGAPWERLDSAHDTLPGTCALFSPSHPPATTARWLSSLGIRFPRLVSIPSRLRLPDADTIAVLERCSNLRRCHLPAACNVEHAAGRASTNSVLRTLGAHCPRLGILVVDRQDAGDGGLVAVAQGCAELRELSCGEPGMLDTRLDRVIPPTDTTLFALARSCTQLTTLRLAGCELKPGITDEGVAAVAEACPGLTEFCAEAAPNLGDQSLAALSTHCRHLTRLNVESSGVTDVGVATVAAACPQLQIVRVGETSVTDTGVESLVSHCRQLEELWLGHCLGITDRSADLMLEQGPSLSRVVLEAAAVSPAAIARLATKVAFDW
eukprot:m.16048 g.16048  ORF g.16048 m.16048 type:complete len:414 (-) comp4999_c0_seq1:234-1475(-)